MTFKVPPILLAVVFAVSTFSATLVAPTAEADTDGCLRIEMGGKDYGVFHNRCDVGLFVIWNDEGACRARDSMDWYPCSHWVPPLGTAGTGPELAGRVTWLTCENDYPRETGNGRAVCEGGAAQVVPGPSVPNEASKAQSPRERSSGGLAGRWIIYNKSAASLHDNLLRSCGHGTHNEFTERGGKIHQRRIGRSGDSRGRAGGLVSCLCQPQQDYVQERLGRHLALRPLPVEERLIVLAAWGSKDGDGASG